MIIPLHFLCYKGKGCRQLHKACYNLHETFLLYKSSNEHKYETYGYNYVKGALKMNRKISYKLITVLITILCLLTICGCSNQTEEDNDIFDYIIEDSSVMITKYKNMEGTEKVVIPDTINGYPVKGIDNEVFMNMTDIINITIPDTVSHIGYNAFKGTKWYENLNDEFVIAGDKVLIKYNGTERNVEIPKTVKYLSACAFTDRNDIWAIKLHEGITIIPDYCFKDCLALKSVYPIEQVNYIGESAYEGTSIGDDFIIPTGVDTIHKKTFYNCKGLLRILLHDNIHTICEQAFAGSSLYEIRINGYDNEQRDYQYGTANSIVLPKNIKYVADDVFMGCESLKSLSTIYVREVIESINKKDCTILEKHGYVYIPLSVKYIEERMFDAYSDITLLVYENSYAHEYAKNNQYRYILRPLFADALFERILKSGFREKGWEFTHENMLKVESILIYPSFFNHNDIEETPYILTINEDGPCGGVENDRITRITSLEDLKYFENLTSLEIVSLTKISDISPIVNCPNLKHFTVRYANIRDISPLLQLKTLNWLGLDNNPIEDFSPIGQLTDLTLLTLNNTGVKDLKFLENLTNLEVLDLCNNQFDDVTPLLSLKRIRHLYLDEQKLKDYNNLKKTNYAD